MQDQDFIKIPVDFKSLHDLKDLMSNYSLVSKLANALNDYQKTYVTEHLMSMDEVLAYIPKSQLKNYAIKYRSTTFKALNEREELGYYVEQIKFTAANRRKLLLAVPNHDMKMFLVNTVDKEIDLCFWASENFVDPSRSYASRMFQEDIRYTKDIEYKVDEIERILYVKAKYFRNATQSVGGVVINRGTRHAYVSGSSEVQYDLGGYDVYRFCTRTNKYLGFFRTNEDQRRGWVQTKSRY